MAFEQGNALVIGVGAYRHAPQINVRMAVADARAVAEVLQDARTCGYPPGQVRTIQDEGATKDGLLTALDELGKQVRREDTAFIFYCGHGALGTDGEYYLVSHDAHIQGSRVVAGSGVSEAELLEKLRTIKAERLLMVFNTCFSGHISPSLGAGDEGELEIESSNPTEETSTALLGTGSGRIIITASRDSQKSYFVRTEPLSIFCQALVDGLRGREVRSSGGYISAYSLYESVYEKVRQRVNEVYYVDQEPELTVLKGVGPFAVALYKGASSLGDFDSGQPAPELPAVRQVPPERAARLFSLRVDTGGGAYIGGSVNTGGGSFVGRDQITYGDKVGGDKISVGDISGSEVAIGRGAQASFTSGPSAGDLSQLFAPLMQAVLAAPPGVRDQAAEQVAALESEAAKADKADDGRMAKLIDGLVELVPGAASAVTSIFASPILSGLTGPVTKFVLDKIRGK